jgi:NAD-dependent dihydropyrimidine dehydrogenase PreA subunit
VLIEKEKCTGCAYCLLTCPVGAIESDGWATINEEKCTLCGECAPVCPNDAISLGIPLKEPRREYQSEYDVVIIGAGIGGLMTGAYDTWQRSIPTGSRCQQHISWTRRFDPSYNTHLAVLH